VGYIKRKEIEQMEPSEEEEARSEARERETELIRDWLRFAGSDVELASEPQLVAREGLAACFIVKKLEDALSSIKGALIDLQYQLDGIRDPRDPGA
jgi:hypothetical protein